jgi:hypothetical protein
VNDCFHLMRDVAHHINAFNPLRCSESASTISPVYTVALGASICSQGDQSNLSNDTLNSSILLATRSVSRDL